MTQNARITTAAIFADAREAAIGRYAKAEGDLDIAIRCFVYADCALIGTYSRHGLQD